MARYARKRASSALYHVILRGVNQQDIFEDDEDRWMFLQMLSECTMTAYIAAHIEQEECMRVYSYCLMSNHVHLLCREILTAADEQKLQSGEKDKMVGISSVMHRLGRKYSMWFNQKYGRCGHLFQDRFNSEPVEDNGYFLTVFRYIARNPYKARMVDDPDKYRWSGWWEYLNMTDTDAMVRKDAVLSLWSLEELREFIHTEVNDAVMDFEDKRRPVTDVALKQLMREICGGDTVAYMQTLPKEVQYSVARTMLQRGGGQKQVSRMTGISVNIVQRLSGWKRPFRGRVQK